MWRWAGAVFTPMHAGIGFFPNTVTRGPANWQSAAHGQALEASPILFPPPAPQCNMLLALAEDGVGVGGGAL